MYKKDQVIILSFVFLLCSIGQSFAGQYNSQFGQDKYCNEQFFKNKRNGVFVDIGASDGVKISNSYFFEQELGWTGLCVEPIPQVFEQLKRNRMCHCVQGCVTNFDGKSVFAELTSYDTWGNMLSGLYEKYDPRQIGALREKNAQFKYYDVQCFTPKTLFEKYKITHIDFLSIDTEGGELDILQAIDFSNIDIDVITVEVNFADDRRIHNYLTTHGYQFSTRLGVDEVYRKIRAPR